MGRKMAPLEAARDAHALLNQAILLLDGANVEIPAAHADLARFVLGEWIEFHQGNKNIAGSLDGISQNRADMI